MYSSFPLYLFVTSNIKLEQQIIPNILLLPPPVPGVFNSIDPNPVKGDDKSTVVDCGCAPTFPAVDYHRFLG